MSDEIKHSPEPWVIDDRDGRPYAINAGREKVIVWGGIACRATTGIDNARRIVACVNACAGIPTEALEAGALAQALDAAAAVLRAPAEGRRWMRPEVDAIYSTLRALGRLP